MTAKVSLGSRPRGLQLVLEQLREGIDAKKCHACGCMQQTVHALSGTEAGRNELRALLDEARSTFAPKRYDCLGCAVCFPAIAANAFTESFPGAGADLDLCPTEAPDERAGWPPLPGDYRVVRFGAPVAVCTLNDERLAGELADAAPDGLAIVGTMRTENLGIERVIENTLANPNIRRLVLCGDDTRQAVGHLPGQSMQSLFANGVDDAGRIVGANGRRPVLKNVSREEIAAFVRQVELVSAIGEGDMTVISSLVRKLADTAPGAFDGAPEQRTVPTVQAVAPRRLVPDPAGYFVVYPDPRAQRLRVEHYANAGVLDCVLEGTTPAALYATVIERGLITRLDHAAYLGRELARAEHALKTGEPYTQDRAAGEIEPEVVRADDGAGAGGCGCSGACGKGDAK